MHSIQKDWESNQQSTDLLAVKQACLTHLPPCSLQCHHVVRIWCQTVCTACFVIYAMGPQSLVHGPELVHRSFGTENFLLI